MSRNISPLVFIPGTLFWVLVGIGMVRHDNRFVGTAVVLLVVTLVLVGIRAMRMSSHERAERARIWSQGAPATAKVVSISTKGGGLNDNPNIDFELDVLSPDGAPYRARTTIVVSLLAIPRIQPGCEIQVRVDANDRGVVLIDESLTYLGYKA